MRLDPRFLAHETKGEHYIISSGGTKFSGIIKNNETAALIVECLKENTSENSIVDRILAEYTGVDRAVVESDVSEIIGILRNIGAIIE